MNNTTNDFWIMFKVYILGYEDCPDSLVHVLNALPLTVTYNSPLSRFPGYELSYEMKINNLEQQDVDQFDSAMLP